MLSDGDRAYLREHASAYANQRPSALTYEGAVAEDYADWLEARWADLADDLDEIPSHRTGFPEFLEAWRSIPRE